MDRIDFENMLFSLWGKSNRVPMTVNYKTYSINYSKALFDKKTIFMVVKPPIYFDVTYSSYFVKPKELLKFFLYDSETDLIVGNINEIEYDGNDKLKDDLMYYMYTAEDKLSRCTCPSCGFWLMERVNHHNHRFMGCSGFPDCEFSSEITAIFDDEII